MMSIIFFPDMRTNHAEAARWNDHLVNLFFPDALCEINTNLLHLIFSDAIF